MHAVFYVRESKNPRSIVESHDAAGRRSLLRRVQGRRNMEAGGRQLPPQLLAYYLEARSVLSKDFILMMPPRFSDLPPALQVAVAYNKVREISTRRRHRRAAM